MASAGRGGFYAISDEGFRAFRPKPLPPHPPLDMSGALLNALSSAATELGRLDGATKLLPDPDFFVYSYVRKEAVLSSQIEGTRSSLVDLLEFEAGAERRAYPKDVREVANYVDAMNYALERIRQGEQISTRLLQRTHARLMKGVRGQELEPGTLRSSQNWIGPPGSSPATADYVPPPPGEVRRALADLDRYIQTDHSSPPLVKAGLVHAQFETIHPFLDGNGRVGRLLITLLLTVEKSLRQPVLYLSYFLLRHRDQYNRLLQRARDDGDWEAWMQFFLSGVRETSVQAAATAEAILSLREEHRAILEGALQRRAGRGYGLLQYLFRHPVISVNQVASVAHTTFPTANALVTQMEDLGLLQEVTGQKRYRFFRYQPYLDLLQRERAQTETG